MDDIELRPGDLVRLKSGSDPMTVAEVYPPTLLGRTYPEVQAVWHGEDRSAWIFVYPVAALELVRQPHAGLEVGQTRREHRVGSSIEAWVECMGTIQNQDGKHVPCASRAHRTVEVKEVE